jgi:hypothetical protein
MGGIFWLGVAGGGKDQNITPHAMQDSRGSRPREVHAIAPKGVNVIDPEASGNQKLARQSAQLISKTTWPMSPRAGCATRFYPPARPPLLA